jgi:radical SAM family uncharacterized protein
MDEILYQVTKPARYSGGEWNSIVKEWEDAEVRVALAYPDLYEIGMSNLAIPILYELLNRQPGILVERVFAPWTDMEMAMRRASLPLFSLESKHPLNEFDIIGFSLGYELTYTNVLNMLDLAGIPVLAGERNDSHPLIIAGGSCVLNPEPMADFIDLFVIGEGEEVTLELIKLFHQWKRESHRSSGVKEKEAFLRQAATIPGIYVPSLYQVSYHSDGTLADFSPSVSEAKPVIERRIVNPLPPPPTKPVVPYIEVIHDRGAVEIQRGCTRGCRFCQAGMIYRPLRHRSIEEIAKAVGRLRENCGYSELSLLSLSTNDYPQIDQLVGQLARQYRDYPLRLSLPSLRIDNFSVKLMDSLPGRKGSLTFAPEAGSQRLRRAINKDISDAEIIDTISSALKRGWKSFKLYFMLGLPTETEEDIQAIGQLVNQLICLTETPRLKLNLATFIPKPHTPFQWVAQNKEAELQAKQQWLKQNLTRKRVQISWSDPQVSLLEGVLSRGDHRLGKVIEKAWQKGSTFDAWSERFDFKRWQQAFDDVGLDPAFYVYRERPPSELLPWSHIDVGISPQFLQRELKRAFEGKITPDCASGYCQACGLEQSQPQCQAKLKINI